MESRRESKTLFSKRLSVAVSALGLLVAVLPVIFLPTSSGPVAFAVLVMKGIGVVVGLGVVVVGLYSYRTGNLRPAMATGSTVIGLVVVGGIGGLVETSGGPLIPIWVWAVSAAVVAGTAILVTDRYLDQTQR